MKQDNPGSPLVTIVTAVFIVGCLSLIPWGDITDNYFKNYNLLSDIFPGQLQVTANEMIDPELAKAEAQLAAEESNEQARLNELRAKAEKGDAEAQRKLNRSALSQEVNDPKSVVNNVVGGVVIIEDYTIDGNGPVNLRAALSNRSVRPARIAVIGDSYIEGDILTSDIRRSLQDTYGGKGVGYMPLSSKLTGFRQTVKQTCSGWTVHELRDKNVPESMRTLSGEYFTAETNAVTSYSGSKIYPHLSDWDRTTVLAIAPTGGTLTINGDTRTLDASPGVQSVVLNGNVTKTDISASSGVEVLGAYLDGASGIAVDNMSLRGNSGITHRSLSVDLADDMRKYIDYDMIIVEYGINALSSQQTDYSGYKKLMKRTIGRLRECYPNADILVMGIGDRGQKIGSEIQSVPTSQNMVKAQRDMAREMGVLFWDTRSAMGGEGAVINWRQKGYINPDYIHLNQKGGKALSELFVKALEREL